ncbi:MAG: universal stress protein [Nevskia sp.]|nr:universal stress protein [Nevskia sp.]
MQKILIPFDGSAAAKRAVQFVADTFKGQAGVHVYLLNVQEIPAFFDDFGNAHLMSEMEPQLIEKGRKVLLEAAEVLQQAGVPHQLDATVGLVAQTIAQQVEALDCQSVVMGTRGLGAVAGLVFGSTATKIVHMVHVPVTLVK